MQITHYRVSALGYEPRQGTTISERRDELRNLLCAHIEEERPDLVVLPETVLTEDMQCPPAEYAEPEDGISAQMIAEIAQKYSVNICFPFVELLKNRYYNCALYINREGRHAGKYHKRVPTPAELDRGIMPGSAVQDAAVIDGIRIGTAICFDENFPDLIWDHISMGVDLIVFPSYTYAGELMRNWAYNCGVPLVCAFPWESVIYDRDGTVLAKAGSDTSTVYLGYHPPRVCATISMQSRMYHLDYNQTKLKEIYKKYGGIVNVKLLVPDGRMMITALKPDININRIEQEFGLVPLGRYLRTSRARCSSPAGCEHL